MVTPRHTLSAEMYEDKEMIYYIESWAKQVYLFKYTREGGERHYPNTSVVRDWVLLNLGPRPSSNHHLYLTDDPFNPCKWILVDHKLGLTFYQSCIA